MTTETNSDNSISIEINGSVYPAQKGQMLIEIADANGISIPRFCYHEKLSISANCRMCLVEVEKAPKPLPACSTPVMDGMKVFTQSEIARKAQKGVMEFLLINHPLDCPVCDQGGECELQDVSLGYGQSGSRFNEAKRVVKDKDIGALVATEMTRCIHCTRCVRFLNEIAGTDELGGIGRGDRTEIDTYVQRSVDTELSGNLVDICPVGALTNKPFQFAARAWEMTARPSLGLHDGLQSRLDYHVKDKEIKRAVPRSDEAVNESWLADLDRYSHFGLQSEDRLLKPMIKEGENWQSVPWDVALEKVAQTLQDANASDIQGLIAPNRSNEEFYLFQRLLCSLGSEHIDHRLHLQDENDQSTAQIFSTSVQDAENMDTIVLLGANPRHEMPLLGHRIRKAWQNGADVLSLGSVGYDQNLKLSEEVLVEPQAIPGLVSELMTVLDRQSKHDSQSLISEWSKYFTEDKKVLIISGQEIHHHTASGWLNQTLSGVQSLENVSWNRLPGGGNAVGAFISGAVPGASGRNTPNMLKLKSSVSLIYGFEPDRDLIQAAVWNNCAKQAQSVIAFSSYMSPDLEQFASVVLPIADIAEQDGTYINVDGFETSIQAASRAPGDAQMGWRVLRVLGSSLSFSEFEINDIDSLRESIAQYSNDMELEHALVEPNVQTGGLQLSVVQPIYAKDALLRRSEPLQASNLAQADCVRMNLQTAEKYGLKAEKLVAISLNGKTLQFELRTDVTIADNVVVLPLGTASCSGADLSGVACSVEAV